MLKIAARPIDPEQKAIAAARPGELQGAIAAGYHQLTRALVKRALKDALLRDMPPCASEAERAALQADAADWLASEDGLEAADLAGFDMNLIGRWVSAGCPAIEKTERTLK